jgi:hypothetical protein
LKNKYLAFTLKKRYSLLHTYNAGVVVKIWKSLDRLKKKKSVFSVAKVIIAACGLFLLEARLSANLQKRFLLSELNQGTHSSPPPPHSQIWKR